MRDRVRARWAGLLAVCAKCEKKLKGRGFGKGGRETLSRELQALAAGKGRKARFGVCTVKCLKLCPKGAVTVVSGARPDDWLIVQPGEAAQAVLARAGIPL